MNELVIFIFGLSSGVALGAWGVWALWLRHEKQVIKANLVIDPKVLHQINASMTLAWLDEQGLTWTAKGAAFSYDKVKK